MKNIIPQALLTMPILSTGLQAQEKQPTPNLVFIMADQYRGDAIGCIGKEPVKTPHLDKLASEGINFTNAISSYPVSSPARGMLMTGMYPIGSKVTGNCNLKPLLTEWNFPKTPAVGAMCLKIRDTIWDTSESGIWMHPTSPM